MTMKPHIEGLIGPGDFGEYQYTIGTEQQPDELINQKSAIVSEKKMSKQTKRNDNLLISSVPENTSWIANTITSDMIKFKCDWIIFRQLNGSSWIVYTCTCISHFQTSSFKVT